MLGPLLRLTMTSAVRFHLDTLCSVSQTSDRLLTTRHICRNVNLFPPSFLNLLTCYGVSMNVCVSTKCYVREKCNVFVSEQCRWYK